MLNETDLSRVDLNLLVLFEVVMEERHVGRAAARLSLSPSAISHGLGRLRRMFDDPLFLRTPRGVTPSARAVELKAPVGDALTRLRAILATPADFDPASSERRFMIGAPDGISAVLLPALLARLHADGSRIRISLRELLPDPGEPTPSAWRSSFQALEARTVDLAVLPIHPVPARFHARGLYEEDFVVAMREDHPLRGGLSLDAYCLADHLLVSRTGDSSGFVDQVLADHGRSRTVAATVHNFMLALAVLGTSDLICALPRHLVTLHGARFGLVGTEAPVSLGGFDLQAVVPADALADKGIAWLIRALSSDP